MKKYPFELSMLAIAAVFCFPSCEKCECPPTTQEATIVLQPANNNLESSVDSYYPTGNGGGGGQITIAAWTHGGAPENNRTYIKFDQSAIPSSATIVSAKLTLFSTLNPLAGNFVDAHYGTNNSCFVQRITAPWTSATINWNSQPSTTAQNQVTLPHATYSFENAIDIDVTQIVKDMQTSGNNGFAIKLQNEVTYNSRQYYSSFTTTSPNNRPKLVIDYKY
jgi:hypothetical protein